MLGVRICNAPSSLTISNMRQYSVPQFIEREAIIIVFLTFKQFFYLIIVGILGYLLFRIFPFGSAIIIFLLTGGPFLALAFIQVGGQPLTTFLANYLGFIRGGKKYTWKKKEAIYPMKIIKKKKIEIKEEKPLLKIASESQLKKLRTKVELKMR